MDIRLSRVGKQVPLYPVAFSAAYVLDLAFAHNLPWDAFVRPLVVAAVGAGVVLVVVSAVTRNPHAAGLLTLVLLVGLATREPLRQLIVLLNRWVGIQVGVILLLVGGILAVAAGVLLVVRLMRRGAPWMPRLTPLLNVVSGLMLVLITVPALGFYLSTPADLPPVAARAADPTAPDIYVVLLDGHPRLDVLRDTYDIEGGTFVSALRGRGFDVAEDSHSNYTYTSLTLGSLLNLDYLEAGREGDGVVPQRDLRQNFRWLARNGDLARSLRAAGYTIVATDSGWEHVSLRGVADRFLAGPEMTELETGLLLQTWIPDLPLVPHDWLLAPRRDVVNRNLASAMSLVDEGDRLPRFAFIHVPSPHMPIVFDDDGGPVPWGSRELHAATPAEFGLTPDEFNAAYEAQLSYLHGRVLDLMDRIDRSPRPSVIIVLSDHGSSPAEGNDLRDLLPNLVAARTPGVELAPEDLGTPLNVLRAVLREYVDLELPRLEPRYWVAYEDQGRIYLEESTPLR